MKLIYCPECEDIVRLWPEGTQECLCGESNGCYVDEINAVVGGRAIPIGIDNHSFAQALADRPKDGAGRRFEAFVIPEQCDTVKEVE